MLQFLRYFQKFQIFKSLNIFFIIVFLMKFTIFDIVTVINGFELSHLNSTSKIVINENDNENDNNNTSSNDEDVVIAFAASEIKEFMDQDNLTEAEIGIIQTKTDDLIYVDIERRHNLNIELYNNKSRNNYNNNNSKNANKNEEIQNLTTKMIEEDNQKIIEIEKKILTETDKNFEIISGSGSISGSNKNTSNKQGNNDDLIQVKVVDGSQTLSDLVIDDDCGSEEEQSKEYKRIEESLKSTNNNQINTTQIDFNDFIQLIPANEVKEIFHEYYRRDKEVERAYMYLMSKDFHDLKNKILAIPEVNIFVKYLKKFSFDIVQLVQTLVNLVGDPNESNLNLNQTYYQSGTDIPNIKNINEQIIESTTMKIKDLDENQNSTTIIIEHGLHGLIDSILDILPQDQIISLFFEKLETNYEFSNLVNNIGNDEFNRILRRMESSIQLKNVIYTLHNNGIYIERIVDSLKGYFFLGF